MVLSLTAKISLFKIKKKTDKHRSNIKSMFVISNFTGPAKKFEVSVVRDTQKCDVIRYWYHGTNNYCLEGAKTFTCTANCIVTIS